ncbi:ribonuclease P protein component [Mycobacterium sp. 1245111.1]|uniref:ribonuclease P protein component n=1 Tax=Mycobacterium sp. 1245111.1 TaxID=1834073 RepID=UPI0007FF3192|nr:ribonuclease P protein component [Mycobacterium sp. 1245111.1]OBK34146.1 ribonuclease P protein component [Mycobacterium sp. 1245111.1]
MLSARNRMTRSTDFDATVRRGRKAVQPDMVIYMRHATGDPKLGLIVSRSVGSAVQRHGLSRRLRHVARDVLAELNDSEHVVIRALPSSRDVVSSRLREELRAGLRRIRSAGPKR